MHKKLQSAALWVAGVMIAGLTALRVGLLSTNATRAEAIGSSIVLGAAAAMVVLIVAKVEKAVDHAVEEDDADKVYDEMEHDAVGVAAEVSLTREQLNGLSSTVEVGRSEGIAAFDQRFARAKGDIFKYTRTRQVVNPEAAPDTRREAEAALAGLTTEVEALKRQLNRYAADIQSLLMSGFGTNHTA